MFGKDRNKVRTPFIHFKSEARGNKAKGWNVYFWGVPVACPGVNRTGLPSNIPASDCVTLQSVVAEDDLYFNPRKRGDNAKPSGKVIGGVREAS